MKGKKIPFQRVIERPVADYIAPHDEQIEKLIIGYLIDNPNLIADAVGAGLDEKCFYMAWLRDVYVKLNEIFESKIDGSDIIVDDLIAALGISKLDEHDKAQAMREDFIKLIDSAYHDRPGDIAIRGHVRTLVDLRARRLMFNHCLRTIADIGKPDIETDEIIKQYQARALQVEFAVSTEVKDLKRMAMDEVVYQENYDPSRLDILHTGFSPIDDTIIMDTPFLLVIGGHPSSGKTAFAFNMMLNMKRIDGAAGVLFSLDNSEKQARRRFITICGGPPIRKMLNPRFMTEYDNEMLTNAAREVSENYGDIIVNYESRITPGRITSGVMTAKKKNPNIKYFVVDYVQQMESGSDKEMTREREIAAIVSACKRSAQKLGLLAVLISQLRKTDSEKEDSMPKPKKNDLRDTNQMQQDADGIILMHKESENILEANIAKQKDGKIERIKLHFEPEHLKLTCLEESSEYHDGLFEKESECIVL